MTKDEARTIAIGLAKRRFADRFPVMDPSEATYGAERADELASRLKTFVTRKKIQALLTNDD